MKLSEAILKGCELTPRQAFGYYGKPGVATCVLAAAAEALGLPTDGPELGAKLRDIPTSLWDEMVNRNDKLRQSREEIAAWLAGEGL